MGLSTTLVPRRFLFRLADTRVCRWLVPAWRCFAWPLAVKRKRFFVPLCVFCFGMIVANLHCGENHSCGNATVYLPISGKERGICVKSASRLSTLSKRNLGVAMSERHGAFLGLSSVFFWAFSEASLHTDSARFLNRSKKRPSAQSSGDFCGSTSANRSSLVTRAGSGIP